MEEKAIKNKLLKKKKKSNLFKNLSWEVLMPIFFIRLEETEQ